MFNKGFSHIGLSTHDLDKTPDFYWGILKFKAVHCETITVKEGAGRDQLIAFMESRDVPVVPAGYDAGINRGFGVPAK